MRISLFINNLLSFLNLALVRKSTLEKMREKQDESMFSSESESLPFLKKELELFYASDCKRMSDLRRDLIRHQISVKWEILDSGCRSFSIPEKESRKCILCGFEGEDSAFEKFTSHCIFGGGVLLRHQCPACDVVFGPDKMVELSSAELSQDYEWHYSVYEEGDSTIQELRAFHLLKPSRDGVYLNYGAGAWSHSVDVLRAEGWNVFAYEPHSSGSSYPEYTISTQSQLATMRFDGIFSNNVLEHIRYPIEELSFMKNLLKPKGVMAHATPCFGYLYDYTRFHLFFFLGRSRDLVARKAGLSIREFVADGEFMCCLLEN